MVKYSSRENTFTLNNAKYVVEYSLEEEDNPTGTNPMERSLAITIDAVYPVSVAPSILELLAPYAVEELEERIRKDFCQGE